MLGHLILWKSATCVWCDAHDTRSVRRGHSWAERQAFERAMHRMRIGGRPTPWSRRLSDRSDNH